MNLNDLDDLRDYPRDADIMDVWDLPEFASRRQAREWAPVAAPWCWADRDMIITAQRLVIERRDDSLIVGPLARGLADEIEYRLATPDLKESQAPNFDVLMEAARGLLAPTRGDACPIDPDVHSRLLIIVAIA